MALENPEQANDEVAQLFQNVGQGLVLVKQYLQGVDPNLAGMSDQLIQGFMQLTEATKQARAGGGPWRFTTAAMRSGSQGPPVPSTDMLQLIWC